jgi:copper(I)-binding protein
MRWRHPVFAAPVLALALVAVASEESGVSVRDAWVREPPPGTTMMAGYMELRNNTPQPQVLVAAVSSGFETVTIHRTIVKDGMAGMVRTSQFELAPSTSFVFAPGGYHLMLMNPIRTLRAGDRVDIRLEFRGGLRLPVSFEVRK